MTTTRYYRSTPQQDQQDIKCNNSDKNNESHGDYDSNNGYMFQHMLSVCGLRLV